MRPVLDDSSLAEQARDRLARVGADPRAERDAVAPLDRGDRVELDARGARIASSTSLAFARRARVAYPWATTTSRRRAVSEIVLSRGSSPRGSRTGAASRCSRRRRCTRRGPSTPPATAAATGIAAAPSATMRARSSRSLYRRRRRLERDDERAADEWLCVLHIASRSPPEPAPSMKEGVYSTGTGSPPFARAAVTGAPVSGSQTWTAVPGDSALSALATPVVSPPPPQGISTASMSASCSVSSSPIVPLPAMTWSSRTGWTNSPSMSSASASSPVSTAAHQSSQGTRTIRPPMRSTAASFAGDALSGTTIVAGTPSSRAIHATPCAMFPVLVVTTPFASADRGASRMALAAPRSLKEPIGCRFSSLSQISPAPPPG